jgi:hypothetical protein
MSVNVRASWIAVAALSGMAALQVLGQIAGSTGAERRTSLPGDELVPTPSIVTDHAITIEAPPDRVWPWLTQVGWHRAGWYTPRWVDRLLFPANWPSLEQLDPALVRDLVVGDRIPDGPPGTAEFVVAHADQPNLLVLHSSSHLPTSWRERLGAGIDWTWTFSLTPADGGPGGTRLHLRVRASTRPWWFTAAYLLTLVPADYVMGPGMLRGLRSRVERQDVMGVATTPFARTVSTPH